MLYPHLVLGCSDAFPEHSHEGDGSSRHQAVVAGSDSFCFRLVVQNAGNPGGSQTGAVQVPLFWPHAEVMPAMCNCRLLNLMCTCLAVAGPSKCLIHFAKIGGVC